MLSDGVCAILVKLRLIHDDIDVQNLPAGLKNQYRGLQTQLISRAFIKGFWGHLVFGLPSSYHLASRARLELQQI